MGLIPGWYPVASADGLDGFPRNHIIRFDPVTNAAGGRHFEIRVPPFLEERTPAGWALSFSGYPIPETPGHPQLGAVAFRFPGRMGQVARVEWVDSEFEDRTNFPVAPASVMKRVHFDDARYRDEYSRVTNESVYASDRLIPLRQLWTEEAQMATQRWVRLVCHPNQYHPTRQILRVHRRIQGFLFFEPAP
jgi:hypothetical protein